jgi:hypothetical protein
MVKKVCYLIHANNLYSKSQILDNDAKLNAKYAISIARKLGATIFVLPEDITEVKSKMVIIYLSDICDIQVNFSV